MRLERLAPLIPPPRAHQVRYHGLLAPGASGRDRVVPGISVDENPPNLSVAKQEAGQRTEILSVLAGPDEPGVSLGAVTGLHSESPKPATEPGANQDSVGRQPAPHGPAVESGETDAPTESAPAPRRPRRHPWADLMQRVFEIDVLCCPSCGGKMRILAAITDPDVARNILQCLSLPARAPPHSPAAISERLVSAFGSVDESSPHEFSESFDFDQSQPQDWDFGA